jgi:hypothetical protein
MGSNPVWDTILQDGRGKFIANMQQTRDKIAASLLEICHDFAET